MTSILKQMEDNLNFKANGMADELWRWQTNKVTTTFVDSRQNGKNEKCLEFPDFERKLRNGYKKSSPTDYFFKCFA
jgi:hypothetical protein